jgi:hypothetical protein
MAYRLILFLISFAIRSSSVEVMYSLYTTAHDVSKLNGASRVLTNEGSGLRVWLLLVVLVVLEIEHTCTPFFGINVKN